MNQPYSDYLTPDERTELQHLIAAGMAPACKLMHASSAITSIRYFRSDRILGPVCKGGGGKVGG